MILFSGCDSDATVDWKSVYDKVHSPFYFHCTKIVWGNVIFLFYNRPGVVLFIVNFYWGRVTIWKMIFLVKVNFTPCNMESAVHQEKNGSKMRTTCWSFSFPFILYWIKIKQYRSLHTPRIFWLCSPSTKHIHLWMKHCRSTIMERATFILTAENHYLSIPLPSTLNNVIPLRNLTAVKGSTDYIHVIPDGTQFTDCSHGWWARDVFPLLFFSVIRLNIVVGHYKQLTANQVCGQECFRFSLKLWCCGGRQRFPHFCFNIITLHRSLRYDSSKNLK